MSNRASTLRDLVSLVSTLRGPDGCAWDRKQTIADIRAYLLEEAHEVAAAIDGGRWSDIASELGDLLFHVAFVSSLAEEAGAFVVEDAIAANHRKMIERHPHVFGEEDVPEAAQVHQAWERRKAATGGRLLDGVTRTLPALVASYRMSQKASGVGFDWPDVAGVLSKVDEELAEVRESLEACRTDKAARGMVGEEIGDLLFSVATLARYLEIDPEAALAATNEKFRRRFGSVESSVAESGRTLGDVPLDELEAYWNESKRREG